jgi:hypothetical protein
MRVIDDEDIGTYTEGELAALVEVELFPSNFAVRWDLCGATSDFFAAYFARLPECGGAPEANRGVEGAISYVLNEVIENAVKFQAGGTIQVRVGLDVDGDELVFVVTNLITEGAAQALRPRLEQLVAGDAQELLLQRVEENAANPEVGASGLGFLTMITDYEARLGWRLRPAADRRDLLLLHTMARLPVPRA